MISWYYYGNKGWKYLFGGKSIPVYQVLYLSFTVLASSKPNPIEDKNVTGLLDTQTDMSNVVFIDTDTYSHWTRDHGPQFIIGNDYWKVVDQQFNGYPEESGCSDNIFLESYNQSLSRPLPSEARGWEEDDNTNIDFANQLNWDIQDLPLYWTGGNFMTD